MSEALVKLEMWRWGRSLNIERNSGCQMYWGTEKVRPEGFQCATLAGPSLTRMGLGVGVRSRGGFSRAAQQRK